MQERRCLFPPELETALKVTLPEGHYYTVMMLSATDVGASAYSQLQKLNKVKDENSLVSADGDACRPSQYAAAWEPKGGRMLKMLLTNGHQVVEAIEDQLIPQLNDPLRPGLKMTLKGPLTCRRGLIKLGPQDVVMHGGQVDELEGTYSTRSVLETRLGREGTGIEHPRPNVADEPTSVFAPKGVPTRYKNGVAPPAAQPRPRAAPPPQPEMPVWDDENAFEEHPAPQPPARGRGRGRGNARARGQRAPRAGRGGRGSRSTPRRPRTNRGRGRGRGRGVALSSVNADLEVIFNDTDDELLASMDLEADQRSQRDEDVFADEEDDFFSQIDTDQQKRPRWL